jgi:hypothetical protein
MELRNLLCATAEEQRADVGERIGEIKSLGGWLAGVRKLRKLIGSQNQPIGLVELWIRVLALRLRGPARTNVY